MLIVEFLWQVAALVPKAELDGEMGDAHMALQARLMSQALRKLSHSLSMSQTLLLFINQVIEVTLQWMEFNKGRFHSTIVYFEDLYNPKKFEIWIQLYMHDIYGAHTMSPIKMMKFGSCFIITAHQAVWISNSWKCIIKWYSKTPWTYVRRLFVCSTIYL